MLAIISNRSFPVLVNIPDFKTRRLCEKEIKNVGLINNADGKLEYLYCQEAFKDKELKK